VYLPLMSWVILVNLNRSMSLICIGLPRIDHALGASEADSHHDGSARSLNECSAARSCPAENSQARRLVPRIDKNIFDGIETAVWLFST
jgi:hypothetical protein